MRIGIDARLINETGVGRYIQNLLRNFAANDAVNTYILFLPSSFELPDSYHQKNWKIVRVDIPWHSVREQLVMPFIFFRESLDVLHVPYFNIPILYPRPYIVTIHDLIIDHFDTGKASTLPYPLYKLRRLGYKIAQIIGLHRAHKIIAVSQTTKKEIVKHYRISEQKIDVIYEGIDDRIISIHNGRRIIASDYFLYVGNAYPHKNLAVLLEAFDKFLTLDKRSTGLKVGVRLVLVGKEDYFYRRLEKEIKSSPFRDSIDIFGDADNSELSQLYKDAVALILPSQMEGFGFPPLESLVNGTPVITSDIPVFHEILNDFPLYFKPQSSDDLVAKMIYLCKNRHTVQKNLPKPGLLLNRFRWDEAALQTIRCYSDSLNKN